MYPITLAEHIASFDGCPTYRKKGLALPQAPKAFAAPKAAPQVVVPPSKPAPEEERFVPLTGVVSAALMQPFTSGSHVMGSERWEFTPLPKLFAPAPKASPWKLPLGPSPKRDWIPPTPKPRAPKAPHPVFPETEWDLSRQVFHLGAKPFTAEDRKEREEREVPRVGRERAQPKYRFIRGIYCLPIKGSWEAYERKPRERKAIWLCRVFDLAEKAASEKDFRRKAWFNNQSSFNQLDFLCSKSNRFELLSNRVESTRGFEPLPSARRMRKENKARVFGPKPNPAWEFIQGRLESKVKTALWSSWREDRAFRRQRMAKLILWSPKDHCSQSLRAALLQMVLKLAPFVKQFSPPTAQTEMFNFWKKANDVVNKADGIDVDKINKALEAVGTIGEVLKNDNPDCDKFNFSKYIDIAINSISQLIHCILNPKIPTFCVSIITFLTNLKIISLDHFSKILPFVTGLINRLLKRSGNEPNVPGAQFEGDFSDDDQFFCGYVSTIISGVAAALKIVPEFCTSKTSEWAKIFQSNVKGFTMSANGLFNFLRNNLELIKRAGQWLIHKQPSIKDIEWLNTRTDEVYEWAKTVLRLTDSRTSQKCFSNLKLAAEVYVAANHGCLILAKMLNVKEITHSQSQVLRKLVDEITKLRDRLAKAHMAPPVRFEPFVYELVGGTGIGKSQLLQTLPFVLLKSLNITTYNEVIYDRCPGNAYWSNLHGQLVCSYDEKFAVSGPNFGDVQMMELFQLKSCCVFNPPMAEIEDKNIRYNPIIVQYASNCAFPEIPAVLDNEALYRRRDILVKVEIKETLRVRYGGECTYPILKKKILDPQNRFKDEDSPLLENFNYLQFSFYPNPQKQGMQYGLPMTYADFNRQIVAQWRNYYEDELTKYKQRMVRATCLYPQDGEEEFSLFDQQWIQRLSDVFEEDKQALILQKEINQIQQSCWINRKNCFWEKFKERSNEIWCKVSAASRPCEKEEIDLCDIDNPFSKHYVPSEILKDPSIALIEIPSIETEGFDHSNKCPHILLSFYVLNCPENLSWDSEKGLWKVVISHGDNYIPNLPFTNFEAALQNFKDKFLIDDRYVTATNMLYNYSNTFSLEYLPVTHKLIVYFSNKVCDNTWANQCVYSSQYLRALCRRYIKANAVLTAIEETGAAYGDSLPADYSERESVDVALSPEAVEAKIGWLRKTWNYLYNNIIKKIANGNWHKWLRILIIILGIIGMLTAFFNLTSSSECLGFIPPKDKFGNVFDPIDNSLPFNPSKYVRNPKNPDYFIPVDKVQSSAYKHLGSLGVECVATGLLAKPEGFASGDAKVNGKSVKTTALAKKIVQTNVKTEMNDQVRISLSNRIQRNSFFLSAITEESQIRGRCLGVCGRTAICPKHYWAGWNKFIERNPSASLEFVSLATSQPQAIKVYLNSLTFTPFENSELGLLTLPPFIPAFKDIRSSIASFHDHMALSGFGKIFEPVFRSGVSIDTFDTLFVFRGHVNISDRNNGVSQTGSSYEYSGFRGKGRCGSILAAQNLPSPIIGIHVAGDSSLDTGYSEAIYREMFESNVEFNAGDEEVFFKPSENPRFNLTGQIFPIGSVKPKMAHRENEKSRIIPSLIQLHSKGEFPIFNYPSVLTPNDPRLDERFSPMIEGCKFHGKPLIPFNSDDLKIAIEDYKLVILNNCLKQRLDVSRLSRLDACRGFDNLDGYEHLEWRTSEGFPFVSIRPSGSHDKKWLFEFDEQGRCSGLNRMLEQVMDRKTQERMEGTIPVTVFTDCLKDCTVPKEKVLLPGKTRVFSMAPVDFTIQQRQNTLDFSVAFQKCRFNLEHAVGINPDSMEWTQLGFKLLECSPSIISADFSKFGDTIPPEIIEACFDIISAWYKENNCQDEILHKELKVMAQEIAHAIHLMFDFAYKTVCGQPSGNALTVILNSMANSIYFRLAWLAIMKGTPFEGLYYFHKYVRIFSFGDDIIAAVHELIRDFFNGVTIQEFFSDHKLKMTSSAKEDIIPKYTTLAEADFLKRGFLNHPTRLSLNVLLAPLGVVSIEDTVNWIWRQPCMDDPKSPVFKDMCLQICEDASRNAWTRGPEYYFQFCNKLSKFWLKNFKIIVRYPSWKVLDSRIFDDGEVLIDIKYRKSIAQTEMDEEKNVHGDETKPIIEKKSNVILESHTSESVANPLPTPTKKDEFQCLAAPISPVSSTTFSDRWITIANGKWSSSDEQGKTLVSLDLPRAFLENENCRNSPNFASFSRFMYWWGHMRAKLMVNSNARQFGQLQAKFYYGAAQDRYYRESSANRDNIWTSSQQPHCLISASASNSGEIYIPYEYIFPLLLIKGQKINDKYSYKSSVLGRLTVKVLIPLVVSASTQNNCTWSLLLAFEDSQFAGMVDTRLSCSEMMSAMAGLALVHEAKALFDNNRDNPTYTSSSHPVTPVPSGSWCIGNGLAEWTNTLRLNPNASLTYPAGRVPAVDEMSIDHVKRIFGLFAIREWNAQQERGTNLISIPAEPLWALSLLYPSLAVEEGSAQTTYVLPPVAMISSMFAYWRGSLELRIDIVGCVELTGRLLVAYVPRTYLPPGGSMDLAKLINCSHSIFDLQNNRQFLFQIPFVSDMMFWPRSRTIGDEFPVYYPPGTVYVNIYQDLIANSTIPDKCKILFYLRGGEDFEVSVPASPSVGLCYNNIIVYPAQATPQAWPRDGYTWVYTGVWHTFTMTPPWILRYSPVSDHVVQFDLNNRSAILGKILKFEAVTIPRGMFLTIKFTEPAPFSTGGYDFIVRPGSITLPITRVVLFDYNGYVYGVPFVSDVPAAQFASQLTQGAWAGVIHEYSLVGSGYKIPASYKSHPDRHTEVAWFAGAEQLSGLFYETSEYWDNRGVRFYLEPVSPSATTEMEDERRSTTAPLSAPQASACGATQASFKVFGEEFRDFKDYCRRYQLYASGEFKTKSETSLGHFNTQIKFPAMPQGLDLDIGGGKSIREYWNRTREGPIPLISSGYRFFTGGMRFRIIFKIYEVEQKKVPISVRACVQHRPNIHPPPRVQIIEAKHLSTGDLMLPGYASWMQTTQMNEVICVEIPYYLPSVRGFLQRPALSDPLANRFSSLGEVCIGLDFPHLSMNYTVFYEIFYSLADDARFSVFVGFPPVMDIGNLESIDYKKDKIKLTEQEEQDEQEHFEMI